MTRPLSSSRAAKSLSASPQLHRAPAGLEADRLADEHDVDAAGVLLVHLENLANPAVLPIGGVRAGVLEFEAVLVDPLMGRFQGGDEFLRTDDEDDVGGAPGVRGELAAGGGGDDT
jgi:hypothetical protein